MGFRVQYFPICVCDLIRVSLVALSFPCSQKRNEKGRGWMRCSLEVFRHYFSFYLLPRSLTSVNPETNLSAAPKLFVSSSSSRISMLHALSLSWRTIYQLCNSHENVLQPYYKCYSNVKCLLCSSKPKFVNCTYDMHCIHSFKEYNAKHRVGV